MMMTSLRRLALAILATVALAAPASAQAPAPGGIGVTSTKNSGSWTVRCYNVAQLPCDMTQVALLKNGGARLATIAIIYAPAPNAYVARFVVPLGVAFDTGLSVQIGNFRADHLRYRRCEQAGCFVEGVLPPAMIAAMQQGGNGTMTVAFIDGHKLQIPIILNGASDSLEQLKTWSENKAAAKAPK